jgi:hypothetical protein
MDFEINLSNPAPWKAGHRMPNTGVLIQPSENHQPLQLKPYSRLAFNNSGQYHSLYKIKPVRLKPFQTPLLGDLLEALGPDLWKRSINSALSGILAQ